MYSINTYFFYSKHLLAKNNLIFIVLHNVVMKNDTIYVKKKHFQFILYMLKEYRKITIRLRKKYSVS